MKLGELRPAEGSTKNTKRLGRGHGSGTGKTSGRGHKGAGSRSGSKSRSWFEGGQMALQRRLPKRGFSNYPFRREIQIINIDAIASLDVAEVNLVVMLEQGMIRNADTPVKVLGNGEITKPVEVSAHAFSKSAVAKIEKAGGSVTFL
ncbi:MAG: 50S ribosomal protein L15 [Candidatus Neomarinimicrobiota bacterium]